MIENQMARAGFNQQSAINNHQLVFWASSARLETCKSG
jgi:hypothetical protein